MTSECFSHMFRLTFLIVPSLQSRPVLTALLKNCPAFSSIHPHLTYGDKGTRPFVTLIHQ